MKKFVLWDKNSKEFINKNVFHAIKEYTLHDFRDLEIMGIELLEDLEIEDINGDNIIADSSILEFEYCGDKYYGYFSYSNESLCYELVLIKNYICKMERCKYTKDFKKLKIIDTIQENKLRLLDKECVYLIKKQL